MSESDEIADRLRRFLADQPDARGGHVARLTRAGSGRSRDNWLFDLETDGGVEPLILRVDPEGALIDTDRSREFAVLRGLERSALPTPVARWLDRDGSAIGHPSLIMRRLPGVCDYR